jgi:hypothetical protein
VGDHEGLPRGAGVDVEMVLGDIETDEQMVHDPSLVAAGGRASVRSSAVPREG